MKKYTQTLRSFIFVALLLLSHTSRAQSGGLDVTFGTGGKVLLDYGGTTEVAKAMAVQPDGKILVAGYHNNMGNLFTLVRFNSNGNVDITFGANGMVTTPFGVGNNALGAANALAIQSDGKILAAGESNNAFAICRYNSDGSLDPTFGTNGKVLTSFGIYSQGANAIAIQSDGKIVVGGFNYVSNNNIAFALARYNTDGSLDNTFDTDGKVFTDFGTGNDIAKAVSIQPDGKIILVGTKDDGSTNSDIALARYNTDGSLDLSFDSDGKLTKDFLNGNDNGGSLALQNDGKIIVVGRASDPNTSEANFVVIRYNIDGSLDLTFDTDGIVSTDFGFYSEGANAVAIQYDGKIVVGGTIGFSTYLDFGVARYNSNGSLDITFDNDGLVSTDFGDLDVCNALAIQNDGKIVVAGQHYNPTTPDEDIALARYGVTNVPLPNSLLSFKGQQHGLSNKLEWQVSKEINYIHFEIEKSLDGVEFKSIGNVSALSNTSEKQDYAFYDFNLWSNKNYYRLKLLDADGKFSSSDIIVIQSKLPTTFTMYPNPCSTSTTISFTQPLKNAKASLYTLTGQLVRTIPIQEEHALIIERENLAVGVYTIRIEQEHTILFKDRLTIID